MTERLYYHDAYLREFTAHVVRTSADGATAYLDRTAFYPTSGGQPFDTGLIGGKPVLEVAEEGDLIAHMLAAPLSPAEVQCSIDWKRRFDHMQQHTGQHLLSAVFEELLALRTVSFHLGQESSTVDLEGGGMESRVVRDVESHANRIVCENRPVTVQFEEAAEARGLRKPSERAGTLRIVTIEGLDRSACGGTHVRATGEIGPILIRRLEKVRQTIRVEFLCGSRAVARARADYEALARIAQLFSAPLDEAPALVAAQLEAGRAADKARRKLRLELAAYHGRELYEATPPGPEGLRRHQHRATSGSTDELGALARSFTARPQAVFVAALEKPPSVIYAVSEDVGVDAGQAVKQALADAGGRGGGNARLGQGSVPDAALLDAVLQKLTSR
jgi:alanyl-tRNA synthetase